jgi:chromosome segregation ATPase
LIKQNLKRGKAVVKVEIELEKLNEYIEKAEKYEETARQSQQYRNWWQGAEAILETKKREIKEKNQEIEKLQRANKVLEARITILDDENQEQYEENETLKKQLEEKNQENQQLKEQLGQIPDENATVEIAKNCRCGREEIENAEKDLEWPEGLQVIAQQTYTSGSVYRGVDLMNNLSKLINVALDETRKGNIAQIVSKDSDNQFIMGIAIQK